MSGTLFHLEAGMKKDIGIGDWVLGILLWVPVLCWVFLVVSFVGIMLDFL